MTHSLQGVDESVWTELATLVNAVAIESTAAFSFAGRLVTVSLGRASDPQAALIASVQAKLYEQGFCRRFAGVVHDTAVPATAEHDDLTSELSAANRGKPRWSDGWTITGVEPNWRIAAQKNGVSFLLSPGEYLSRDGRGVPPRAGSSVSTYVATESLTAQPGFYFAFGESMEDHQEGVEYVRFYWSVAASAAAQLVSVLTERLNRFCVLFRYKCQRSRIQYERLDPAVLYLDKKYYQIATQLVAEAYTHVRDHMKPTSPILTKVLAPGLSLAEDPPNGDSFGMHRCGILAESLWEAHARGIAGDAAQLDLVETSFTQHEVALERPYLNPGSVDWYTFSLLLERSTV